MNRGYTHTHIYLSIHRARGKRQSNKTSQPCTPCARNLVQFYKFTSNSKRLYEHETFFPRCKKKRKKKKKKPRFFQTPASRSNLLHKPHLNHPIHRHAQTRNLGPRVLAHEQKRCERQFAHETSARADAHLLFAHDVEDLVGVGAVEGSEAGRGR